MCEYGLNINFLIFSIVLTIIVFVFVRGLSDGNGEIHDVVIQLHLAHGIIAFETDGVAAVEHALHGKATDEAKVEWLIVFGLRTTEVKPIGRSKPAREPDVILCL